MTKTLFIFSFFLCWVYSFISYSQPVANFNSDIQKGCIPLTINFQDLSTGSPNAWLWDFGNGNTSIIQNPEANYTKPGVYSVRLIVQSGSGKDTLFKQGFIKVYQKPTGKFSADTLTGCAPFSVGFNDESVPGSSSIKEWLWDFGDGNNSVAKQPVNIYTKEGNFTVSQIIKDINGCQDYTFREKYILVNKPDAGFKATTAVCQVPASVPFENFSTKSTYNYFWDFGDGVTSTSKNPTHTFGAFGNINVLSAVTDNLGCSDTLVKQLKIIKFQPGFDFSINIFCDSLLTVNVSDTSFPTPVLWRWEFGDGKFSLEKTASHTYIDTSKEYNVKLMVTLKDGCRDSITKKIYFHPSAAFSVDTNYTCQVPFTFNFTNQSVAITPFNGLWDFNDGNTLASNDTTISHTYIQKSPKIYAVSLVISDKYNCNDTLIKPIEVNPPVANFVFAPPLTEYQLAFGFCPDTKNIVNTSISKEPIISWKWTLVDFFNNTTATNTTVWDWIYPFDTGIDTLTLTVQNAEGCADTLQKIYKIGMKPETMDFEISPSDSLCVTHSGTFTPVITFTKPLISANEYCWDFNYVPGNICRVEDYDTVSGNGIDYAYYLYSLKFDTTNYKGSNMLNTSYVPNFETQNIRLISGYNGCFDTLIKSIEQKPPEPLIGCLLFDKNGLASCSAPATFAFYNHSSRFTRFDSLWIISKPENKILKTSTEQNDTMDYTFNKSGEYQINVLVYNDTSKCSTFGSVSVYIDSILPRLMTEIKTACLQNNRFQFHDSTKTVFANKYFWKWKFGDGDTIEGPPVPDALEVNAHSGRTRGTYISPTHAYRDTGTYIIQLDVFLNFSSFLKLGFESCSFTLWDTIRVHGTKSSFQTDTIICKNDTAKPVNISYSTSNIIKNKWFFGDDSDTSIAKNPEHIFKKPGLFALSLYVEDDNGCTDSSAGKILVSYPEPEYTRAPDAYITIVPQPACLGDTLNFELLTNYYFNKYKWNFGDNSSDTLTATNHIYNSNGTFYIQLNVTDTNACQNTMTVDTVLVSLPPTANFSADLIQADCPPLLVTFKDSSSTNVVQWDWDFGDAQSSELQNPKHIYNIPGDFNVRLTVMDAMGCRDSINKNGIINIKGPYGYYTVDKDSGCAPLSSNFKGFFQNAKYYLWDFGDGVLDFDTTSYTIDSINHNYTKSGIYSPSLILKDSNNCIFIAKSVETLLAETIQAYFSYSGSDLCNLSLVQFTDTVSSTFSVSRKWDFGDGTVSSLQSPAHQYINPDTYFVTLTVISSLDTSCKNQVLDSVFIFKKPKVTIQVNDSSGCIPLNIQIMTLNEEPEIPVTRWNWLMNDSLPRTEDSTSYLIHTAGKHKITLYYYYADTCKAKDSLTIKVMNQPTAGFIFIPKNPTLNNAIQFDDQSVGGTHWKWYFGTGDSSVSQNPSYSYPNSGIYQISQIINNEVNCFDTLRKNINVAAKALVAVPDAFTPNGDGNNDRLYAYPAGISELIEFKIFNRWGELVFKTNDIKEGWDGTFKGLVQEMDTYMWLATARENNSGNQIIQKGEFMLLR